MIRICVAFALLLAGPAFAKDYVVTPETYASTMAALVGGDTVRVDPSTPTTAVFPSIDQRRAVHVYSPPVTLVLTGYTFGTWYAGDISGVVVRGGTFDGGDAHNAILGVFRNSKLLGIATRNGTASFNGSFENVYIENLDCSGSRSDCLDTSVSHGLEINGMNCHDGNMQPGAHPDCVQMTSRAPGAIDGVTFRNVSVRGHTQGIVNYGSTVPTLHIVVRHFRIFTSMYGALALSGCHECIVDDVLGSPAPGWRNIHLQPSSPADAATRDFTGPVTNVVFGRPGVDPGPWIKSPEKFPVSTRP